MRKPQLVAGMFDMRLRGFPGLYVARTKLKSGGTGGTVTLWTLGILIFQVSAITGKRKETSQ